MFRQARTFRLPTPSFIVKAAQAASIGPWAQLEGLNSDVAKGARTSNTVTQPEHKERHAQNQPVLIRTLKSLGIPAL